MNRFALWTDEPNSEVVDAFTMRSRNQSRCPCGKDHRATSFISPPRGLERTVVRRAKSDRLRACFVVPTNHKAGYWKQLRSNSRAAFSSTILKLLLNTLRHLWRRILCFWSISEELIRRRRAVDRSAYDADGSRGGNHTRRRSSRSCGESRRLSTEAR